MKAASFFVRINECPKPSPLRRQTHIVIVGDNPSQYTVKELAALENLFCNLGDMDDMGVMPQDVQVVAMAYVPIQFLGEVYDTEKGLDRGTIFPELDKPFLAGGCCCE